MDKRGFLGRYELKRELGRGAMGVVYEGWDSKLQRQVAVKTILTSQLVDPELAAAYSARFMEEARNAGQLIHPNIVTVFDFGNEAGVDYLVMELVHGNELKSHLDASHPLGIGQAVAIACQLLEALDYVHSKGIFHRDIKPANVMLEAGTGRVRLTDFGVARLSRGAGHDGSRAGTLVGTPSYMSPEQIKGLPTGAATDLFATGVLLYQCLTLRKPFVGNNEWDVWQKIVNEEPLPLSRYREQIPAALERAVLHALAKDPRSRPASARAFIDELQAAIEGESFDAEATRAMGVGGQHGVRDNSQSRPRTASSHSTQGPRVSTEPSLGQQTLRTQEYDIEFWRSIMDSEDEADFRLYLQRYPDGYFAEIARRKIGRRSYMPSRKALQYTGAAALGLVLVAGGILLALKELAPGANELPPIALAMPVPSSEPANGAELQSRASPPAQPATAGREAAHGQDAGSKSRAVPPAEQPRTAVPTSDAKTRQIAEQKKRDDSAKARAVREQAALAKASRALEMTERKHPVEAKGAPEESPATSEAKAPDIAEQAKRAEQAKAGAAPADTAPKEEQSAGEQAGEAAQLAAGPDTRLKMESLMEAALVAERTGNPQHAMRLYNAAYLLGSSSAEPAIRNIGGRAARAMGDLAGRASNYFDQRRWYGSAKELGVEPPALDDHQP